MILGASSRQFVHQVVNLCRKIEVLLLCNVVMGKA